MPRLKDPNKLSVTLTLTKETNAMLNKIAKERHLNRSQAINQIISEYVEAKELERSIGKELRKNFLKGEDFD